MLMMYWILDNAGRPKAVWLEEKAMKLSAKQLNQSIFSGENGKKRRQRKASPAEGVSLPKVA